MPFYRDVGFFLTIAFLVLDQQMSEDETPPALVRTLHLTDRCLSTAEAGPTARNTHTIVCGGDGETLLVAAVARLLCASVPFRLLPPVSCYPVRLYQQPSGEPLHLARTLASVESDRWWYEYDELNGSGCMHINTIEARGSREGDSACYDGLTLAPLVVAGPLVNFYVRLHVDRPSVRVGRNIAVRDAHGDAIPVRTGGIDGSGWVHVDLRQPFRGPATVYLLVNACANDPAYGYLKWGGRASPRLCAALDQALATMCRDLTNLVADYVGVTDDLDKDVRMTKRRSDGTNVLLEAGEVVCVDIVERATARARRVQPRPGAKRTVSMRQ